MTSAFTELEIGCDDPQAMATFWGQVLGSTDVMQGGSSAVVSIGGSGVRLAFTPASKMGAGKGRLQMRIIPSGSDGIEEADRLVALGASLAEAETAGDGRWLVLTDPEGNEFHLQRTADPSGTKTGSSDDGSSPDVQTGEYTTGLDAIEDYIDRGGESAPLSSGAP